MQPKYTIQLNTRVLTNVLVAGAAFALGALVSFLIFRQPAGTSTSVPPEALKAAEAGGEEILQGVDPTKLDSAPFTQEFTQQYATEYDAFIKPIRTMGLIAWEGIPVVTWTGSGFLDVALAARTQAGIVMLELRMARVSGGAWAVDRLLSIQLREAAQ
ncbi:MAG: hypothetical protein ABSB41_17370 [Anaerolineales bacterium]|jgi:hypothetical protein